tara:strand:+ start:16495 stop:18471 length:1977 start_codon:yes stop_codon:yes gene_type:complete
MATNRYTNISTSQFNPLSLQEIMMVPLGKQKEHDNQQAQMEELGIFDVNRLESDDPYIKSQVEAMRNKTSSLQDELMSSGTSKNLAKKMMGIKRERDTFLSNDGAGGRANNAYTQYHSNVEALNKNKHLTSTQREKGLQTALEQYKASGGAEKSGVYNAYQGADNVELEDLAAKRAGEMSAQEISNITGWSQNEDGSWSNGTTTTETLSRDVIQQAVLNSMSNDPKVQAFLQDAQEIGMINDPFSALENASWNAADRHQIGNVAIKEDFRIGTAGQQKSNGSGLTQSGMNWNLLSSPGDYRTIKNKNKETTLSMINRGALHNPPIKPHNNAQQGRALKAWNKKWGPEGTNPGGTKVTIDDLSQEDALRYNDIARGLVGNGRLSQEELDRGLSDPEVLKQITDYDNKYKNYTYNVKVISDTSGGVGNYSSGTISKDAGAVLSQAKSDKFNQLFMHPETGKVYTWDKLQTEFGVQDVDMVQGYVDVDNNLSNNITQKEYSDRKGEFASPMSVVLTDENGKQLPNFYMTRNRGQMNRPRYQADMELNKFFGKSRSLPEIGTQLMIGNQEYQSSYLPEATVIEMLNEMGRDVLDAKGLPKEDADPYQYGNYILLSKAMREAGNRNGVYMLEMENDEDGIKNYKTKQQIQAQTYRAKGLSDFQ